MSKPGVIFDLDGTFLRWQWTHAWIVGLVDAGLIERVVLDRTDEALQAYRKRQGDFDVFINELVQTFFDDERLNGVLISDVEHVSSRLALESGDYVHIFTRELNEAAQELGFVAAIVTGSPTIAVKPFADKHGIPIVIGTELPNDGKRFTSGKLTHWLKRKHLAVRQIAKDHDIDLMRSVAVGDSETDAGMFYEVSHPIAFQPNPCLEQMAEEHSWTVVTEKKVIRAFGWCKRGTNAGMLQETHLTRLLPKDLAISLRDRLRSTGCYRR